MSTILSVTSASIDSEDLNELTLDLCRAINSETDVTAEPAGAPRTQPGDKGDAFTIGSIVLGLISSGGVVVTLISVLKSYVERGRPIEIELEHPDGRKLKIKGDNVQPDQL